MNKKFSTLVAGLLLAGGAFSSAYAVKISTLAGTGKVVKIARTWERDSNTGNVHAGWQPMTAGYYLTTAGITTTSELFIVENAGDGKVSLRPVNGTTLDKGDVLTVGGVSKFTVGYNPAVLGITSESNRPDFNQFEAGTDKLGQGTPATSGVWPLQLVGTPSSTAKNEAFDAVVTSLQVATVDAALLADGKIVKISCNGSNLAGHYEIVKDGDVYSFIQDGEYLIADDARDFNVVNTELGLLLKPVQSDKYVAYVDGDFTIVDSIDEATLFGVAAPAVHELTAAELKWYESGSFSVTIKGYDGNGKATVDLTDNVFSGSLTPVALNTAKTDFVPATDSKFFLQKSNGNFIVAKANLADGYEVAYQFTEVSKSTLLRDINKAGQNNYFSQFTLKITEDVDVRDIEYINEIEVFKNDGESVGTVKRFNFRNVAYLAVAPVGDRGITCYPVSIKMGGDQVVDWTKFLQKGKFAVVKHVKRGTTNVNKLLGIDPSSNSVFSSAYAGWVKSAVNDLETQWAVTIKGSEDGVDANDTYVLTNRENPTMFYELCPVGRLYSTSTANLYRIGTSTYQITFVEGEATDGYQTLDPIALKNQQYYVGVYSPVWKGTAWLTENHVKEHKIGLDSDKDNANLWILTPNIAARQDKEDAAYDEYYIPTDSVYIVSEIAYCKTLTNGAKTYETTKDTLKIASYSLQNVTYREYINNLAGYDYYSCNPLGDKLRVALRTNGEYVNLIPVNAHTVGEWIYKSTLNTEADYAKLHQNLNHYAWSSGSNEYVEAAKIYAGDSAEKGLLNNTSIYSQTENDLFVLEAKEAPAYLKLNQGDVIRIYREGNESEQLFEDGEFASLGNAAQLKDMNPALYVDTAWMNRNEAVNRYDYMLAVNVDRIEKAYECNVPDHKDLYHYVDTTYGRFLVNLVDSTVINEDINDIHYSKYEYLNMPKLGFKYGFHTADKFFVPNAKDTTIYTVGNANRNIAKFAFQMVDDKNFVIETSYDNNVKDPSKNYVGYLKWINGNLVVSGWSGDAEVFSLTTDDRTPTANEVVAAEVSVVAVKGAIIVKGAAGKVVTVANILGQTIANQVAASDNVTIAAPAGIAVVTVDGEATKVVVK